MLSIEGRAATLTVNSLADVEADDGACTLREAIISANSGTGSGSQPGECAPGEFEPVLDRIEFSAGTTGTLMLGSALPALLDPVEIIGPGADRLTLDGSALTGNASILRVLAKSLVEGLTLANNISTSEGGAIDADQSLTILDIVFEDNRATTGGAIHTTDDLTVERSEFRRNVATDFHGGAIRLADSGRTLIVRDSLFENNETALNARSGGAIHVGGSDHVTEISGSTFVGNAALGEDRDGGALRVEGQSLTIVNSTFSDNTAADQGGAIWAAAATNRLINVTATANRADRDSDGNGDGGGLFGLNDVVVINSLLAGNFDSGLEAPDCSGTLIDSRYNLVGNGNGCSGVSDGVDGNQVGTFSMPIDPMLEALADNGGETPTHALLAASPAIDAGDPAGCEDALGDPLTVDQRGRSRPRDGDGDGSAVCDIGAFELAGDRIFMDRFED
jgi:CSLREA domain-containing protein